MMEINKKASWETGSWAQYMQLQKILYKKQTNKQKKLFSLAWVFMGYTT